MTITPRVAYDARLAIGQYRGMGRFLRALISGHETQFVGMCASGEADFSENMISSGFRSYPLWEQLSLPRLIARNQIDVFLAPYNTAPLRLPRPVKLVLVIHDLIYLEPLPPSTSMYQNMGRAYRRIVVPKAVQRADVILTVSHYTKRQVVTRLGVNEAKIRVIPNSLTESWFATDTGLDRDDYIFILAGEAPSKNLSRAIVAFARFREMTGDKRRRLKIGGVKQRFHAIYSSLARRHAVLDCVDFLGYENDEKIRDLYRRAEIFLMPSLMEGFGIPVLEAMASGVPVLASSTSCLPEVAGSAARYFDPTSVEDIAAAIRDVAGNTELQKQMRSRGIQQALKFHPKLVNQTIQEFWSSFLDGSNTSTRIIN